MFGNLARDVRYASRLLARSPGFTAVAILSLALGIGANSVVFSVFHALLFQPLPVPKPEELVSVFTASPAEPWGTTSHADLMDLRRGVPAFRELIGYTVTRFELDLGGERLPVLGERVSGNYFSGLGARLLLGRGFTEEEDVSGGPRAVVLSESLWRRKLGADPGILGRRVRLNGEVFTVVGVAPAGFRDTLAGLSVGLRVPLAASARPEDLRQRGHRDLLVLGRLRPGAKLAEAAAQMQSVAAQLQRSDPETNADRSFKALAAAQAGAHPRIREMLSLLGLLLTAVVGIVLVLACLNLANLLLARAWGRQREVGIRLSVGATRRRLIRQLLAESVFLSLLGGAVGLLLAVWATGLIRHFRPPAPIPIALDVGIDAPALGFTLLLSLLTGCLFGLAPALAATRPDLNATLKGLDSRIARRLSLRNVLVVAQVAVSIVLLVGAALFLRSLGRIEGIDPGFDTAGVLLVPLDLKAHGYEDQTKSVPFLRNVLARVQSLPGVRAASLAATVPLDVERKAAPVQAPDRPGVEEQLGCNMIAPGYFGVMGIPLRGRDFGPQDGERSPRVAIVNEALAQRYWPGRDAIGQRWRADGIEREVVGVAKTTKVRFLGEPPTPFFYLPRTQEYTKTVVLHLKTGGYPLRLADAVRRAIESLDPQLQGLDPTTLEARVAFAMLPQKVGGVIFIVAGLLALGLACMGIYGVISYSVRQRRREMAIRLSVGARPRDVVGLVVRQSMLLVGVGIGIGLLLAYPLMTFIGSWLYGVSAADPLSFASVIALLALSALAATYGPARRATDVEPMQVMRCE
jgi:macrolide transport system ATP-binding/permease protein